MEGVAANQVDTYYFDIEKCKHCPFKEGCYKEGAKSKTYSVSIKSNVHTEQMEFQESDYFKEKSKERYKIEAKYSELKHRHGYDVAKSSGLIGGITRCHGDIYGKYKADFKTIRVITQGEMVSYA